MKSSFVLFDLDGTLIDSVPALFRAFDEWIGALPVRTNDIQAHMFNGISTFEIVEQVRKRCSLDEPAAALELQYFSRIHAAYDSVEPTQGAEDLLQSLKRQGVTMGLVTAASEILVRPVLERFGWASLFSVCQTGERGQPCKPDPYPYRSAAARIGRPTDEGVAVEDSQSGVTSAHRAGLRVIGLDHSGNADNLKAAGASHVVRRLAEAEALI